LKNGLARDQVSEYNRENSNRKSLQPTGKLALHALKIKCPFSTEQFTIDSDRALDTARPKGDN
jgi:hypothetical protein